MVFNSLLGLCSWIKTSSSIAVSRSNIALLLQALLGVVDDKRLQQSSLFNAIWVQLGCNMGPIVGFNNTSTSVYMTR